MRYSVLTYIFDNYEFVREPYTVDSEAEYLLVTDNPRLTSEKWTIVYDKKLKDLSTFDKCYYVRFHLFEYAHTDICVRIDGSIQIKDSLRQIVDRFENLEADIMLMMNPVHNYLHEDYEQWVQTRNYPQRCADRALAKLNSLGYDPFYKGYYQANFVIERNNELTNGIDRKTFELLKELGEEGKIDRLDQPIWCFIINKYYGDNLKVMPVDEYIITFSRYLQWCRHNSTVAIPFKTDIKPAYLFNRLVECDHFDYLGELSNDKDRICFLLAKLHDSICLNNSYENTIQSQNSQFDHMLGKRFVMRLKKLFPVF